MIWVEVIKNEGNERMSSIKCSKCGKKVINCAEKNPHREYEFEKNFVNGRLFKHMPLCSVISFFWRIAVSVLLFFWHIMVFVAILFVFALFGICSRDSDKSAIEK